MRPISDNAKSFACQQHPIPNAWLETIIWPLPRAHILRLLY